MPNVKNYVQGHSGAIIALAHILVADTLLLFSSAEDTQVLVWECSLASQQVTDSAYSQWTLRQKLDIGNGMQHCLAVAEIPGQHGWYVTALSQSSAKSSTVVLVNADSCCCYSCHNCHILSDRSLHYTALRCCAVLQLRCIKALSNSQTCCVGSKYAQAVTALRRWMSLHALVKITVGITVASMTSFSTSFAIEGSQEHTPSSFMRM